MSKTKFEAYSHWIDPICIAERVNSMFERDWLFLHSSKLQRGFSRYSIICFNCSKKILGEDFTSLKEQLGVDYKYKKNSPFIKKLSESWFGYLSYELGHNHSSKKVLNAPNFCFAKFDSIILFDHKKEAITFCGKGSLVKELLDVYHRSSDRAANTLLLNNVGSNFTDQSYKSCVSRVIEKIKQGEFCEANLTRKYFGKVVSGSPFYTYKEIYKNHKVPYGAFLNLDKIKILSFSPEQFLKLDGYKISSQPIKGTMPAGETAITSKKTAKILQNCEKNKSENLMIVDLVRNDLSKNCITGSVKVPKLFKTNIYENVIHMYSKITGEIDTNIHPLEPLIASFPPGSMTGAPKAQVVKVCNEIERYSRGIYSGSIGYYHPCSMDFSVVIRTLIIENDKFEFQVGGAIVYDSKPESELEELYAKAKPFRKHLGI